MNLDLKRRENLLWGPVGPTEVALVNREDLTDGHLIIKSRVPAQKLVSWVAQEVSLAAVGRPIVGSHRHTGDGDRSRKQALRRLGLENRVPILDVLDRLRLDITPTYLGLRGPQLCFRGGASRC